VCVFYRMAPLSMILNDPNQDFIRLCHYSTLNISETVCDTDLVKSNTSRDDLHAPYWSLSFQTTLSDLVTRSVGCAPVNTVRTISLHFNAISGFVRSATEFGHWTNPVPLYTMLMSCILWTLISCSHMRMPMIRESTASANHQTWTH